MILRIVDAGSHMYAFEKIIINKNSCGVKTVILNITYYTNLHSSSEKTNRSFCLLQVAKQLIIFIDCAPIKLFMEMINVLDKTEFTTLCFRNFIM